MKGQPRKKDEPARKNMGPTGPVKMPPGRSKESYEDKHPNPGNTGQETPASQSPRSLERE